MLNINNINNNMQQQPKKIQKSSVDTVSEQKVTPQEKSKVSGSLAAAIYGIKQAPPQKRNDEKSYVENLSFADKLSPEDKRNLISVLKKGGEEADYMQKLLVLINQEKVTPTVTQSLCANGVMSDAVKNDIDIWFNKVEKEGMSVKDAFIPEFSSQKEAEKASAVGDVFRVNGEDKIYVKSGDDYSTQLEMDSDTYLKLYPPVERFAACQNSNGDCFFLSAVNSIMENPYSRVSIYECFTQDGNDIVVDFPGGDGTSAVRFEDGKMPDGFNPQMYTDGPLGMKFLEHMYGFYIESQKYEEYQDVMYEEIELMEEKLEKLQDKDVQDEKTIKKQENLSKKIEDYQNAMAQVEEAMADPNHKMAFVLDDLGEFVMGKFGPMTEDIEKINSECSSVSNYYIGFGGETSEVTQAFGYDAESYEVGMDDDYIDEALYAENPYDYIISATTYAEAEEDDDGSGRVEKSQNKDYSIYSKHAYKILPFDDEKGNRMFKVTNPWNQSHRVIMDVDTLKTYFEEFSVAQLDCDE